MPSRFAFGHADIKWQISRSATFGNERVQELLIGQIAANKKGLNAAAYYRLS